MSIIALVKSARNNSSLPSDSRIPFLTWGLFLGSAFIFLILLPLFQKGCFIDGMLYKTVAYNYAEGLGFFWSMKFTDTSMVQFCEQPPLYFFLLGNVYALFGSNYLVDRFFTLFLFICFLFLLYFISKQLFKKPGGYFLLLVFIFLAIPVFCWSYVNQIIEPLLCVFTGVGIFTFMRFTNSGNYFYALAFSLTLYCLFLTKGFQSCFLIGLPISYAIVSKFNRKNYLFAVGTGIVFLLLLYGILRYHVPAASWLDCYYQARLVLTMQNVGNTTDNHFEIIGRFYSELLGLLGILVLLFTFLKIRKTYPLKFTIKNFVANKLALSLLITSLLGSLPFALSLVQRGFYLIPSFICFVLAAVFGLKRYLLFFILFLSRLSSFKFARLVMPLVFVGSIIYFSLNVNAYKRNRGLLQDVDKILPYLQEKETVVIDSDRWNDFSLHAYLYMAKKISLTTDKNNGKFLIRSKSTASLPQDSARLMNLGTAEIDLYRVQN